MIRAASESRAVDDEGEFESLGDLLNFSGENKTHTVIRAALRAALAAAPPAPVVEIKPLEWDTYRTRHSAYVPFGGRYVIVEYAGMAQSFMLEKHGFCSAMTMGYSNLDEAKAAAQTHHETRIRSALVSPPATSPEPLQARVQPWLMACFGPEISADKTERNHRFLEEALELVQACGCTASEAHQLVDYVYGRDVGEPSQEAGGVMITLAALCLANGLDMHECGETELARIWTKVEQIRAKQAAKPKNSPLPEAPAPSTEREEAKRLVERFDATPFHAEKEMERVMDGMIKLLRRIAGGA
jgi:hypothetical protein